MSETDEDGKIWEEMWAAGIKAGERFDKSACAPALVSLIATGVLPSGEHKHALVPGCGRGYEVYELAVSGLYQSVTALDISASGLAAAKSYIESQTNDRVVLDRINFCCADFFDCQGIDGGYSLIFDYTFLCALPVKIRPLWARKMAELIAPEGQLVTLMYPLLKSQESGGPPFGLSLSLYEDLLTNVGFVAVDGPAVLPDALCHEGREGGDSGIGRWKPSRF